MKWFKVKKIISEIVKYIVDDKGIKTSIIVPLEKW